ncbi:nitrous oxide reductase accessory protein NosL [Acidovorax sp. SRB_24]|uniref:nitrous oxide reductase accessory protein NosL n=1 Tax=Acidovorax sp. SRB_24 TaxID=1962700 RepID=UPI00145DF162|nr:nitrous oxide reductase accessory protein NosL [Acidovorax sp. SRB_24]NMM76042.1 hypothetical protein [Acidovorax sp. SRB_24]
MLGMGLLAVAALALWQAPALRAALAPQAELAPDVCVVAPPTPYDPALGLPVHAARAVPAGVRCPVCGMYPERAPQWAAQVIFANGDAHFFDSPLSLLMYLGDVGRYSPGRQAGDIVAHYVTDTASQRWTDARQAFYVHGSSARGPMRAGNLPAFAARDAAERFAAQRGGAVLAFGAIDAATVQRLDGQAHASQ